MSALRQYHLTIPDTTFPNDQRKIAISEWGDAQNKHVLFCVHGLSRNARDFDYLAQMLCDDYRVIAIDVAGRGKSDWLNDKDAYTYDTYVQDCVEVLRQLGIKRVDWLGTSMGGLIGMLIAAQMPQLIYRLILNDIGPHISSRSLRRILKYVQNERVYETREAIESVLRIKLSTFGLKEEAHWQHLIEHSIEQLQNGSYRFNYDPAIIKKPLPGQPIPDIELFDIWHAVPHPTLVIRGSESDVLSAETALTMQDSGPLPTLITLEGIGHAPTLMEKEQITLIRDWLRESF